MQQIYKNNNLEMPIDYNFLL